MTQEQQPEIRPGLSEQQGGSAPAQDEPKHPDECPSCGAVLKDVPDVTDSCPHCGHEFANVEHFGHAQWHKNPRALRDTGE